MTSLTTQKQMIAIPIVINDVWSEFQLKVKNSVVILYWNVISKMFLPKMQNLLIFFSLQVPSPLMM